MAVALRYLDTSALTKLVVQEQETDALRRFLRRGGSARLVSSALARTELRRAVLRFADRSDVTDEQARAAAREATSLLRRLDLVRVGAPILDNAGRLGPARLRSLDAIHLATALALGPRLQVLVAYDERLVEAARQVGLSAEAPTRSPE